MPRAEPIAEPSRISDKRLVMAECKLRFTITFPPNKEAGITFSMSKFGLEDLR
jgi:hypothetical protein